MLLAWLALACGQSEVAQCHAILDKRAGEMTEQENAACSWETSSLLSPADCGASGQARARVDKHWQT